MTTRNSILSVIKEINKIQSNYFGSELNEEELREWIIHCIKITIEDKHEDKKTFTYSDCRIQYFKSLLMFSLIKIKTDSEGYETGTSYDIGINIKPYLLLSFGTDCLPVLQEAFKVYLKDDFEEISVQIFEEIDSWCRNVDFVFSQLSLVI